MDKLTIDFWGFEVAAEGFYGVSAASMLVLAIVVVLKAGRRRGD